MEFESQILRLVIVGGFLSLGLVGAILLRHCFFELHRLVLTTSPWQRAALLAVLVVAVVFGGGKGTNDVQNAGQPCGSGLHSISAPNLRTTSFYGGGHLYWRSSANEQDFDDFNLRLDFPTNLVVSNLVFYGIRPESGSVLFALTWPQLAAIDDYCYVSLYANWTLDGGPWIKVDTPFFWWSDRYLAGRLNWPDLVDEAISEGFFPTNATPDSCFLRAAWWGDSDNDWLDDGDELFIYGTDPENPDTDNDEMDDGWEVDYGTSPTNPDTDGDGLLDGWEWLYDSYGFDPLVSNAEADVEVDWDQDGLSNILESRYGTDPWCDGTDWDWLPDGWEVRYGLDPLSEDGDDGDDGDPDHDGLPNYDEYDQGTDPTNPDTDGDGLLDSVDPHPLVSDGSFFGQCDHWVQDNFSNASQILSVGYTNWVNGQVGVGLVNGCYALKVKVLREPEQPVFVCVGNRRLIVNEAGEYPFLLSKGSRYKLSVSPEDAPVDFEAVDDVGGGRAGALLQSASAQWANGEWSSEDGRLVFVPPRLGVVGYVVWLPSLSVSPSTWEPTESRPSETFTAVFTDAPSEYSASSYSWSGGGEVVSIATPTATSTRMTCLDPSAGAPPLTLSAVVAGETMHSYFIVRQEEGLEISFDLPDTMFVDDDDDDGDGNVDDGIDHPLNDDLAEGRLELSSSHRVSGTYTVETLNTGWNDVYYSETGLGGWQPLRQGQVRTVEDRNYDVVFIRVVPCACSQSFEQNEIRIRWTSQEGHSQIVTKRFTVVSPEVEPICTEWVANGSGRSVLNPCGVVVGRDSVFRIKVKPNAYPDSKIVWSTTGAGAVSFPEGNTGREVKVRGVSAGEITLKAQIGECTASAPSFHAKVVQPKTVKLSAWIVAREDGTTAFTPAQVRTMVREANEIYSQVGVTLNVGNRIVVTNLPSAFVVNKVNSTPNRWNVDRLFAITSDTQGLECYFVSEIIDDGGTDRSTSIVGVHCSSGLAVAAGGCGVTLAHEIGHAFGMKDVYGATRDGRDMLELTRYACAQEDWNGGCHGLQNGGERYYPESTFQCDIVGRLLMDGSKSDVAYGFDITFGAVRGYSGDGSIEERETGYFDNVYHEGNPLHH